MSAFGKNIVRGEFVWWNPWFPGIANFRYYFLNIPSPTSHPDPWWLLLSPDHQQRYQLCRRNGSLSSVFHEEGFQQSAMFQCPEMMIWNAKFSSMFLRHIQRDMYWCMISHSWVVPPNYHNQLITQSCPGRRGYAFKCIILGRNLVIDILNIYSGIILRWTTRDRIDDKSNIGSTTGLMFAFRNKPITWTNVDKDPWHCMASLGYN